MFYEIRRYQTRPGRRAEWVQFMHDVVLPYQQAKGMSFIASFTDRDDPDGYVWIRRFDNDADRDARYAATYQDPQWTDKISPTVRELLHTEASVVTEVEPTTASPMQ